MSVRSFQRVRWGRREWTAFVFAFGVLILPALVNGYPFLFPDSWGYYGACPDEMRSPVLGCAMRPVTLAGGVWAFIAVQCAVAACAIVLFDALVLENRHRLALYAALAASLLGLFSGWLMADVWTPLGLMFLFALACGRFHPAGAALLAFACATHFGNFPVFGAAAAGMLPFVRARASYAARVAACFLAAILLVVASNLIGGKIRFGTNNGHVFLASRILHDMPEVLEAKCRQEPGFAWCASQSQILSWSAENHQSFTWHAENSLGLSWEVRNRLSREIVVFSVAESARFIRGHAAALVRNTAQLLFAAQLSNGFEPFGPQSPAVEDLRECYPDEVSTYLGSWQASGRIERLLKILDRPFMALNWAALLICLAGVAARWKDRRDDLLTQLALFVLIALAANAFFMSALSGTFGRYQTRLGFLLLIPALALLSRWFRQKRAA